MLIALSRPSRRSAGTSCRFAAWHSRRGQTWRTHSRSLSEATSGGARGMRSAALLARTACAVLRTCSGCSAWPCRAWSLEDRLSSDRATLRTPALHWTAALHRTATLTLERRARLTWTLRRSCRTQWRRVHRTWAGLRRNHPALRHNGLLRRGLRRRSRRGRRLRAGCWLLRRRRTCCRKWRNWSLRRSNDNCRRRRWRRLFRGGSRRRWRHDRRSLTRFRDYDWTLRGRHGRFLRDCGLRCHRLRLRWHWSGRRLG